MRLLALIALAVACAAAPATADAGGWTARSPGRALSATVAPAGGELVLRVRHGGRAVVAASLGPAPSAPARVRRDRRRESFSTPAGKRRRHVLDATRVRLAFPRRSLEVLVADDGVAFRARGAHRGDVAWRARGAARAWLQALTPNYENPYVGYRLQEAPHGRYAYPALLRTPGGAAALLTESGMPYGAAGGHLALRRGELRVRLPSLEPRPARTPWRVAVVGSLPTVVGSDLPLALGGHSRIADPAWIRPGRAAWSWWADSSSPRRLGDQQRHVDAAAAAGWEYVLVDEGWDPAWVPELVAYASARGVRVLLWADWRALETSAKRAALLGALAGWGVAGVKIDFLQSDRAARMRFMADAARAAARRRLVVGFHGVTVPRGFQRTWPNALTFEAVIGAEHAKSGTAIDPAHDVNLVFTRNVIGSMDYTPAALSARGQRSTVAHRLAQAIAFESGIQHYADTPASYAAHPAALALLSAVPAAWDDTRLLAGAPDRFATVARRAGDRWFVGAVSATRARTEHLPLAFLPPGRSYAARLISDDGAGGLRVTERAVTAADALEVAVAVDGGYALQLIPR